MNDFYSTLGVPPNAPVEEIKDRYRFLAHAYHPDKFSSDAHKRDADEAFKRINEAFQTLSNPNLRADYDRRRTSGPANQSKSSPPPRPAPEPSPPRPSPSHETIRPGAIKYTVAAIFWSIIGGMLGSLAGPLCMLAGIIVGLWFGIWVCNREAKPSATKPPPRPHSGGLLPLSRGTIVILIIATGIGVVVFSERPSALPTKDPWDQFQDAPAHTPVTEPPSKPTFDPTTAKPTGFEDLGAILADDYDRRIRESRAATKERPFVNSLGMKFVPVPISAGPTDGQIVLFSVWDTRVEDYAEYVRARGITPEKPSFEQGPTHPVVMVSWDDAKGFCAWLSQKEGLEYRLPTDAEWSWAMGAQEYPWGNRFPPPEGSGNYGSSLQLDGFAYTSPVGSFSPNWNGLYDMGGNVWQWCEDRYDAMHEYRVVRGGAWNSKDEISLGSPCRSYAFHVSRGDVGGFRCVLIVPSR